jgi:hypothetical protein
MTEALRLAREFGAFARYLGWRGTTDRLQDTYIKLHPSADVASVTPLDGLLTGLARYGWFSVTSRCLWSAGGAACLPHQLVLVLAILESSRVSHATTMPPMRPRRDLDPLE